MIYRYTALRKAGDAQGELKEAKSFEELANFVQHARDNDNRGTKDGAGICAPMKNGYRSKENILPRNWIAIDIDGPHELDANGSPIKTKLSNGKERIKPSIGISSQTISDICTALARYEYFWHPSYSDKAEHNGRGRKVRFFLPLDKELPAPEWETVTKNFIAYLEEKVPELAPSSRLSASIDPASATAAQFMYTCGKEKAVNFVFHKGEPIKTADYRKGKKKGDIPTTSDYKPRRKASKHEGTAAAEMFDYIDPILEALHDKGLYIKDMGGGKHAVKCPSGEHDDGAVTSTVYYEPGAYDETGRRYRYGAFKCMHQTCAGRRTGDFLKLLGIDYDHYTAEIDAALNRDPDNFKAGAVTFKTTCGIVFISRTNRKGETTTIKYFPEIEILGLARDADSSDWGRVVRFKDYDGKTHETFISNADLTGNGEEVRERLTGLGFELYCTGAGINRLLCDYIYRRPLGCDPQEPEKEKPRILRTTSAGWLNNIFVTPEKIYGQTPEAVFYEAEKKRQANYEQKGTLDGWKAAIAYSAEYSDNLTLAISAAFAAPLVRIFPDLIEQISAGFHFFGESGTGKTTIMRAAASVWGRPDDDNGGRISRWTDTANELEFIAAAHNDSLLCLDELTGTDAREVEQKIYRMSGNKLKARANKDLSRSSNASWRILFISTGEEALESMGVRDNFEIRAGALSRLISLRAGTDLTSQTGETLGVFERIPEGMKSIKCAYELLDEGYSNHYGTAGSYWLEYITENGNALRNQAKELEAEFYKRIPQQLGHQQRREIKRFCFCAIAGELASAAGVTGWSQGHAIQATANTAIRYLGPNTAESKEVRRFLHHLKNDAEDLSNYAPTNDMNRVARCGYRNFDFRIIRPTDEDPFPQGLPDADTNLEVLDHIKADSKIPVERRLILHNSYFAKIRGSIDEKKAAAILEAKGVLVMKNSGRRKLRVRLGGALASRYVIDFDKLINLDDSEDSENEK